LDSPTKYRKNERVGRLDERVTLQGVSESTNTYGERVETWITLAEVWARLDYNISKSREVEEGGQESAQQSINFTVRRRTDVNEITRVLHSGRIYDIEAIAQSNDGQYTVIKTKLVKP
jgi:SPP1 family predicted phage head-tail adaptor